MTNKVNEMHIKLHMKIHKILRFHELLRSNGVYYCDSCPMQYTFILNIFEKYIVIPILPDYLNII